MMVRMTYGNIYHMLTLYIIAVIILMSNNDLALHSRKNYHPSINTLNKCLHLIRAHVNARTSFPFHFFILILYNKTVPKSSKFKSYSYKI